MGLVKTGQLMRSNSWRPRGWSFPRSQKRPGAPKGGGRARILRPGPPAILRPGPPATSHHRRLRVKVERGTLPRFSLLTGSCHEVYGGQRLHLAAAALHDDGMPRVSRKKRFLMEHPLCCFCGGTRRATTLDHVPPKACFPIGFWPEQFEFPSCSQCNNGTSRQDTIFGYYSILLDFNEANRTAEDQNRLLHLGEEIGKRYPEALPDVTKQKPVYRVGRLYAPSPVAISLARKPAMNEAVQTIGEKLAHALYYRETKKILMQNHRFFASAYQIQDPNTDNLTDYFKHQFPNLTIGTRSNVKSYGSRFAYRSGYKLEEDFFVFAAQFGYGLILWGMVLGAGMEVDPSNGALKDMRWRTGGCGLGSEAPS